MTGARLHHKRVARLGLSLALVLPLLTPCLCLSPALATKLNAKPLPHDGSVAGSSGTSGDSNQWGRPNKDFSNDAEPREALPATRWQSRRDYRAEDIKAKDDAVAKQKAAVDAAKKGREDQVNAIKQYQQISIDANNKGVAFGKQGKWLEAISQHELACKYDPGNKAFRINLSAARTSWGQKLLAQKDFAAAANYFRKALTAMPDNGLAAKHLSEAVQRMGLDPALSDNRLGIGDQLAAAGDVEGANVEYQQAMLIDPSARTYTKMGDMSMRYGQAANAMNWYRQAVVKDTEYGPAHRQLGMIMIMQKDNTGAAAELRKAVILDSKDVAAGQSLIEIWRRQVALNPLLAENHLGLATAMQLTGDYTTADNEYRQVEQLDPRNASLANGRASLQRAIKHTAAEKHHAAAETFFNQGLPRDSLAEEGQAVMIEPRNDKYQFLLGQCLEANGDMAGARQAFHTCVLINPKNDEAASHLRDIEKNGGGGAANNGQGQPQQQQQVGLSRPDGSNGQQSGQVGIGQGGQPTGGAGQRDKNMFEGSPQTSYSNGAPPNPAANAGANGGGAFSGAGAAANIQSQRQNSQSAPPRSNSGGQQPPALQMQTIDPQTQATLTAADNLEVQHDFQGAANLLKQSLSANLQNAEIHHRLAVNLLNLGQLEEAVSEFRIASALSPGSKVFIEDYARALKIHKKALSDAPPESSNGGSNTQATGALGDLK